MHLVITGTSTGIGRALAEHRLAGGDEVWGLARSDQSELAAKYPGRFHAARCDVAQWEPVRAAAAAAAAAWPGVDALVTGAAVQGEIGPALTLDPAGWSATVRTNLDGTYYAIRAFHELLLRPTRRAKIVCLSGGGGTKARPNFSAYAAAKTGVIRLVETLAEELRGAALDINAVAPGAVTTRMTEEVLRAGAAVAGAAEYQAARQLAEGGGGALARALGLIDWLLSPASDGISGRLLSAPWDPWPTLDRHREELAATDIYTLRRIVPADRGRNFPA
jgi:NAD(P)-dependent dehydrogenase (short-subunit alcohol dehydrogenase family)